MLDLDQIRAEPLYAKKLAELRALSDEALISQHDALVQGANRPVNQEYYLQELYRREAESREKTMVRLTAVVAVLTVVNVIAVIAAAVAAFGD